MFPIIHCFMLYGRQLIVFIAVTLGLVLTSQNGVEAISLAVKSEGTCV